MTTLLKPNEVSLLISVVKHAKAQLNFTEPAEVLGITTSAASQRWGRLKKKLDAKGDVSFGSKDEILLLSTAAKQFGANDVDFKTIGAELGCSVSAANQRWGRLRKKIVIPDEAVKAKKHAPLKDSPLKPSPSKVTKKSAPSKRKSKITNQDKLLDYVKEEEAVRAGSVKSEAFDENDEDLIMAQLQEERVNTASQGYESEADVDEEPKPRMSSFATDFDPPYFDADIPANNPEVESKTKAEADNEVEGDIHSDYDEVEV